MFYFWENVWAGLLRLPSFNDRDFLDVFEEILSAEVKTDSFESDFFGDKTADLLTFEERLRPWWEWHDWISPVEHKCLCSHEYLIEIDDQFTLRDVGDRQGIELDVSCAQHQAEFVQKNGCCLLTHSRTQRKIKLQLPPTQLVWELEDLFDKLAASLLVFDRKTKARNADDFQQKAVLAVIEMCELNFTLCTGEVRPD